MAWEIADMCSWTTCDWALSAAGLAMIATVSKVLLAMPRHPADTADAAPHGEATVDAADRLAKWVSRNSRFTSDMVQNSPRAYLSHSTVALLTSALASVFGIVLSSLMGTLIAVARTLL